jgi:cell division control protein 6
LLLEYAGEIAVEKGNDVVTESDVRDAQDRLEMGRITEVTKTLPFHQKLVLYAIVSSGKNEIDTSEVYVNYRTLCEEMEDRPLRKVRISNFISELDMLGLIFALKVSRGRHGITRIITPNLSEEKMEKIWKRL